MSVTILTSSERGKVQAALVAELVSCDCGEVRHLKHARRWILIVKSDGGSSSVKWACADCARETYEVTT